VAEKINSKKYERSNVLNSEYNLVANNLKMQE
jgi:hypothetical protein